MNIFFLNSVVPDSWGGGEKWMLKAAEGLRARGHQVFSGGRSGSLFLQRCTDANIDTLPLTISGDFNPATIAAIAGFFRRNQIDVAIPNFNKDVRLAGIAGKFSTRPLVVARSGLPILRNKLIYRLTYRWLVDGIITNTAAIKSRYLSYGWLQNDFIRVIHNGIEIQPLPQIDEQAIRQKFSLPDRRPVIGIFGRLAPQKQHDQFLNVAKNIVKKLPDAIFMIVGDGPLKDNITQQTASFGLTDSVFFTGFLHNPVELYAFCDLVLLTSENEGLPNVVMEAMHFARPVIAFNVGGVAELIRSPETGVVVAKNDVDAMSTAAIRLLNNPDVRQQIGTSARRFVIDHFSMHTMIDNVETYLTELLNQ